MRSGVVSHRLCGSGKVMNFCFPNVKLARLTAGARGETEKCLLHGAVVQ